MTREELSVKIEALESLLSNILPDNWQDKFETHEDLYELFERSFFKAEAIASQAIELLKLYR
jgi:hypothetical protein